MNIVNGGGYNLPRAKVSPRPPPNPHVCFHFYVMIKGIEKSLVIWSVWMPLKRMLETISPISSLKKSIGGGTIYPGVKCPPPSPSTLMYAFMFIAHPLEGHSETLNDQALLSLFDHYIKMKAYMRAGGGGTLHQGSCPPPPWLCS